jgi:hypothetical protein
MTNNIPCIFVERKWMRAAKAWRCCLELPDTPTLAAVLTAYIDTKIALDLESDGVRLTIDPAFIVDVPSKGKRFFLVVETVSEKQAGHGPVLTAFTSQNVKVTIRPEGDEQAPVFPKRGSIDPKTVKGLHMAFFKSQKFWEFLLAKTGAYIKDEHKCKAVFKTYMQVESCTEIDQENFDVILKEFNCWMNGAPSA